jgi:hypothetical protein
VAGESPAVRVAVRDPDPGGRALTLGGVSIASVTGADAFVAGVSLPTAAFSGVPPSLASDLFLTVELGSLTLRYAR